MKKEIIKLLIAEKQQEIERIELQQRAIEFDDNASYVIVGIRRAGKSYQMFQDIKRKIEAGKIKIEDCLYINFEDERVADMQASDLGLLLECYAEMYDNPRPLIYLDEIQNIEGWEKFARRIADSKYRVIITGSNARMLSHDIATTLGGRYIVREVFPFSFAEYLTWNDVAIDKNWEYNPDTRTKVAKLMETYLHFGGFAECFGMVNKREWVNSLYQKILLGDIVARNNIRNGNAIRLLAKKLAECVMQPTTQTRLLHIVKSSGNVVGRNTIADFLGYMNDAYLTFDIANYIDSLAERASNCKRYYFDNALLNNFLVEAEPQLLENIVAIDLVKRYRESESDGVYFYNKGIEVDFYVPNEKMAIQVSYSISDSITREREIRALVKLASVFDVANAIIITRHEESVIEQDGMRIDVIPIHKWLLRV